MKEDVAAKAIVPPEETVGPLPARGFAGFIGKFTVLRGDFTEENGYLTPSLKLKRNVVMRDFHDDVEALYAPAPSRG